VAWVLTRERYGEVKAWLYPQVRLATCRSP